MGKYKNDNWYIKILNEYMEEYGDIPPPWVYRENSHPYSIGWRMGGGETHVMVLWEWLEEQQFNFEERLEYLKKYPAPPRWYQWIVDFLWEEVDPFEFEDEDYLPYFKKLEEYGFKGMEKFQEDMEREDLI